MAIFYRGAGIGSHWHTTNYTGKNYTPRHPTVPHNSAGVVHHVVSGTSFSPYLSISRSYEVAWSYAVVGSGGSATKTTPAYVYQIQLSAPLPTGLTLYEPVWEAQAGRPPDPTATPHSYFHDGGPDILLGIVDPAGFSHVVARPRRLPPAAAGAGPPSVTSELRAMVMALRDAEVLAFGVVPGYAILGRHPVW